jgi:hypothetical protein
MGLDTAESGWDRHIFATATSLEGVVESVFRMKPDVDADVDLPSRARYSRTCLNPYLFLALFWITTGADYEELRFLNTQSTAMKYTPKCRDRVNIL